MLLYDAFMNSPMLNEKYWDTLLHLGWRGPRDILAYYGDNTSLHFIIRSCIDLKYKMLLLEKSLELHADLNQKTLGPSKATPLMLACKKQNEVEITKWLLKNGANVNAMDISNETVVFWLRNVFYDKKTRKEFLNLYLEAGLDVNLKDHNQKTILDYPDFSQIISVWESKKIKKELTHSLPKTINASFKKKI